MDQDAQRLEDRIRHVDEIAQARLETALARIDGTFARIDGTFARMDARFEKMEADFTSLKGSVAEFRSLNQQTKNTVVVTGIGTVLAILGLLIGMKQVWIGGVQVGQADRVVQVAPAAPAGPNR